MEQVGSFTYSEWCRKGGKNAAPPAEAEEEDDSSSVASSSSAESGAADDEGARSDDGKTWTYKPMREAPKRIAVQDAPSQPSQSGYYCYPSSYQYPQSQQVHVSRGYPSQQATPMAPPQQSYYACYPHQAASGPAGGPYTYYCYPDGQPVNVVESSKKPAEKEKKKEKEKEKEDPIKQASVTKNIWIGRTKAEVDEDNRKVAEREGVYRFDEMQPKNAQPSTMFWVVELDKSTTLRNYASITDDGFGPGKWERDERYGNMYFIREKAKKDKKKK